MAQPMRQVRQLDRIKTIATIGITILIGSLLLWQYMHEGIPGHYILQSADAPYISNGWGIVVLPVLTWITVNAVQKRAVRQGGTIYSNSTKSTIGLFGAGGLTGLAIVIAFIYNYTPLLNAVPYLLLLLGLLMPIFYAEFMLGFVLAMTYTFGAVLPTLFFLVFLVIGFLLFKLRTFLLQKLFRQNKAG